MENSLSADAELRRGSSPAFGLRLEFYTISCPCCHTFRLKLELHHQLSWVFSLLTADLGTSCYYYFMRQHLIINHIHKCVYLIISHIYVCIYICLYRDDIHIHILLFLFLWRTLTNTDFGYEK